MKYFLTIISLIILPILVDAQSIVDGLDDSVRVNWIDMQSAIDLAESGNNEKQILVFIFDPGDHWSKFHEKSLNSSKCAVLLNTYFLPVRFSGKYPGDIYLKEEKYSLVNNGRIEVHELVSLLLNNRIVYPTTTFLKNDFGGIFSQPGYQMPDRLEMILNYVGKGIYKKTSWEQYQKELKLDGGN